MVGLSRFELETSCPPDMRANQAALQPANNLSANNILPYRFCAVKKTVNLFCPVVHNHLTKFIVFKELMIHSGVSVTIKISWREELVLAINLTPEGVWYFN